VHNSEELKRVLFRKYLRFTWFFVVVVFISYCQVCHCAQFRIFSALATATLAVLRSLSLMDGIVVRASANEQNCRLGS